MQFKSIFHGYMNSIFQMKKIIKYFFLMGQTEIVGDC